MKKFSALTLAITLVFTLAACRSNEAVDEGSTTFWATEPATEPETRQPTFIKDFVEGKSAPDYIETEDNLPEMYKEVKVDSPLDGNLGPIVFYYVPDSAKDEGEYYPSYLRVKVNEKSEDFSITFTTKEKVFPGNIAEGVVYLNGQESASDAFNVYRDEKTLTLNGFQPGLKKLDLVCRMYMPAMEVEANGEKYPVYNIQFIF